MPDAGYIKLYRQLTDNWLYDHKPFCKSMAWIDILLSANHKGRGLLIQGNIVPTERGQLVTSLRKLAGRWGWSHEAVRKFLTVLEGAGQIKLTVDSSLTVITVVNWALYQSDIQNCRQSVDSSLTQSGTNKNDKKERNIYGGGGDGARTRVNSKNVDNIVENRCITPESLFSRFFGASPSDEEKKSCADMLRLRDAELIEYAFRQASISGHKNYAYVCGVMKNLRDRGIKDMSDLADYDMSRETERRQQRRI